MTARDPPLRISHLAAEDIEARMTASRGTGLILLRALPNAGVLQVLFTVCGTRRLGQLIARHSDKSRTGRPSLARFVEVKKPEEAVSADQKEELAFLRSLGLQARVLCLIER